METSGGGVTLSVVEPPTEVGEPTIIGAAPGVAPIAPPSTGVVIMA